MRLTSNRWRVAHQITYIYIYIFIYVINAIQCGPILLKIITCVTNCGREERDKEKDRNYNHIQSIPFIIGREEKILL